MQMISHRKRAEFGRKLVLLSVPLLFVCSTAAYASGSVDCVGQDEEIELGIGMSRSSIFEPMDAYFKYFDEEWATKPESGEASLGNHQGMIESDRLAVDYLDENGGLIAVSLRVNLGDETGDGYKGIVTFADGIDHSVFCTFG